MNLLQSLTAEDAVSSLGQNLSTLLEGVICVAIIHRASAPTE